MEEDGERGKSVRSDGISWGPHCDSISWGLTAQVTESPGTVL